MTVRHAPWPAGTPCWAELAVQDPARSQEFYRAVLGWEHTAPDPEGRVLALVDGAPVAGLAPGAAPDGAPVWQVHLACDRIEACAERVLAAGGEQLRVPAPRGSAGTAGLWRDPTGAVFGLWQAGELIGFTAVDVPGAPVWCDLTTPDPDGARDFYAQVFGYAYTDRATTGASYAAFTVPGGQQWGGGIGGTDPAAGDAPAVWSVCFAVEDADAAAARARGAGGAVMEEPMAFEYGRLAVLAGPDRESFAVMSPTAPEDGRAPADR